MDTIVDMKAMLKMKTDKIYLGNVQVVWTNGENVNTAPREGEPVKSNVEALQSIAKEDDLPF